MFRCPWKSSSLQNYHEFEVSKHKTLSTCSTRGYYILTQSRILKPPESSSFRGSKSLREHLESHQKNKKFAIRRPRTGTSSRLTHATEQLFLLQPFGTMRRSQLWRPTPISAQSVRMLHFPVLSYSHLSLGETTTFPIFVAFPDFSDLPGRLQPSKTTIQKTLNALGVEESSSPRRVLHF